MGQHVQTTSGQEAGTAAGGARHVTIFFSDIIGFASLTDRLGDSAASELVNRLLEIQAKIIAREGAGRVVKFIGDAVFAVFDVPSQAMSRALEIQRALAELRAQDGGASIPGVRMGLHVGEVLLEEGGRLDIVGRHVNRARRVMEAAEADQVLVSRAVVEAGRDFIKGTPEEHLAVRYYGEYYLKGVGAIDLSEIADLRCRRPSPLKLERGGSDSAVLDRLQLAGYRGESRIGEGAFGVVYKATGADGATVAVKVLSAGFLENPAARARFEAEAAKLHELPVAGVVKILDRRLDHSPPFIVTEFVDGRRIDGALAGADARRIARVFRDVAAALGRIHARGIVHRDLKPGNVLVRGDDSPVILDLGTAALEAEASAPNSGSTAPAGTPGYLAPEQLAGERGDAQSDVYALGVMLFEVLTGRAPFEGRSVHQVIESHMHEDPPLPSVLRAEVPDALQRVCLKALEKQPADRYGSTGEMIADFERFLRDEVVRTRPTLYDNLIYHRARQHVGQIEGWVERGLLSVEEKNRLLAAYEPLLRRGISAVMEGRLVRAWQLAVFIGGWLVVNGAAAWLALHWADLGRFSRLLLGSVPAVVGFALGFLMHRVERFRLQFVALVVAVLATPLLSGVWLYEFEIGAMRSTTAFHELLSSGLSNRQICLTATMTFMVALGVMLRSGTVTHSAHAALAAVLCYSSVLLHLGLLPRMENGDLATVGAWYLPLLGMMVGVCVFLTGRRRAPQSPPWVYLSAVVLVGVVLLITRYAFGEWMGDLEHRDTKSFLAVAAGGMLIAGAGLLGRMLLAHRARLATLATTGTGLVTILLGLYWAGAEWPWWGPAHDGRRIPPPHLLLPVVSIGITLISVRIQMLIFMLVGLFGLSASIHLLGYEYFPKTTAWPAGIIGLGLACLGIALVIELRRTRGHAVDDVASRTRL